MVAISNAVANVAGIICSLMGHGSPGSESCDLSKTAIPLSPAQQTALGSPNTSLAAVGLGFGVQNYTCSANNVFVSTGAVGEIFDISRLASTNDSLISTIHNDLFDFWNSSSAGSITVQQLIECLPYVVPPDTILAQHYFIPNSAGGISPIWDFRATPRFKGVDDAVFVGKVLSNTTSADPTRDIALLHLGKVSGDILDEAYRIFTVGGVPPSSCVSGTTQDISIKYVSQYWLYGGSLGLNC